MKLDKAIEIQSDKLRIRPYDFTPDEKDATELGIQALIRFNKHSPYPHEYLGGPLPGETEE